MGTSYMISIHALREEGDRITSMISFLSFLFLSTPSARRATVTSSKCRRAVSYFYPRPPRGGRHHGCQHFGGTGKISIHALREEGDLCAQQRLDRVPISIHALREEGDKRSKRNKREVKDFYPRPPRGGRPPARTANITIKQFLSTPSARRATRRP